MKIVFAVIVGIMIATVAVGFIWMKSHGYHTISMTQAKVVP